MVIRRVSVVVDEGMQAEVTGDALACGTEAVTSSAVAGRAVASAAVFALAGADKGVAPVSLDRPRDKNKGEEVRG